MDLSVNLFVFLSVYLPPVCPSLSVCLFAYLCACLCVYLSVCGFVSGREVKRGSPLHETAPMWHIFGIEAIKTAAGV